MRTDCEAAQSFLSAAQTWVERAPSRQQPTALGLSLGASGEDWHPADPWAVALSNAVPICAALQTPRTLHKVNDNGYHVLAGQINDMSWHARTFQVPDHKGCFVICASSALKDAIYTLAKALVFANLTPQMLHDYAALDLVIRVMRAQVGGIRQGNGWNREANLILPSGSVALAEQLTAIAETFIVLHEIAHIAHGDLQPPATEDSPGRGGPLSARSSSADLSPTDREHLCDLVALDALMLGVGHAWDAMEVVVGVELALGTHAILEEATWWDRPTPHTPARHRFKAVEWGLEELISARPRQWRRWTTANWRPTPMQLADQLLSMEYLGPYGEDLAAALAARPDIFENVGANASEFYSAMEWSERYIRSPPVLLYLELFESVANAGNSAEILRIVAPPSELSVPNEVFEEGILGDTNETMMFWGAYVGGYVLFYDVLWPRLESSGFLDGLQSLRFTTIESVLEETLGEAAVGPAKALLIQLRGGVHQPVVSLTSEERAKIRRILVP